MIDEKGRLFGKINIVDLIVILVIVIAAVVVGMKFLGGGNGNSAINPTRPRCGIPCWWRGWNRRSMRTSRNTSPAS